jgi:hypothetical protein
MSIGVPFEGPTGYALIFARNQAEVDKIRADEKKLALAECQKLGIPVQQDDQRTVKELYLLCNTKPAAPEETKPTGEVGVK